MSLLFFMGFLMIYLYQTFCLLESRIDSGGGPSGPVPLGFFFFKVIIYLIFVVGSLSKTLGSLSPQ